MADAPLAVSDYRIISQVPVCCLEGQMLQAKLCYGQNFMRGIVAQVFRIKVSESEPDSVKRIGIFENRIQQPDAVSVRQRKSL